MEYHIEDILVNGRPDRDGFVKQMGNPDPDSTFVLVYATGVCQITGAPATHCIFADKLIDNNSKVKCINSYQTDPYPEKYVDDFLRFYRVQCKGVPIPTPPPSPTPTRSGSSSIEDEAVQGADAPLPSPPATPPAQPNTAEVASLQNLVHNLQSQLDSNRNQIKSLKESVSLIQLSSANTSEVESCNLADELTVIKERTLL